MTARPRQMTAPILYQNKQPNSNDEIYPAINTRNINVTDRQPGEMLMPCHEYCGTGHEAMWAKVQILPAAQFLQRARTNERLSCVPR